MPTWSSITGGMTLPPRSDDSNFGKWNHILAIVDDTTAQLATILASGGGDIRIIKDMNDDGNHMCLIYYIQQKVELKSDKDIRAALQKVLQTLITKLYKSSIKLPIQWGRGARLYNPKIGLI
jgi:hypothetical protein